MNSIKTKLWLTIAVLTSLSGTCVFPVWASTSLCIEEEEEESCYGTTDDDVIIGTVSSMRFLPLRGMMECMHMEAKIA